MRLADFIDRLIEIQNSYDCDDHEVSIMTELPNLQIQHKVTDVAFSGRSGIIVIGQELDESN